MLTLLVLLADGAAAPAAPAPAGWISPEGLNAILLILLLVVSPLAAAVLRRFEKGALADKLDAATKDAIAMRGALTSTVTAVERFRQLSSPAVATELVETITAHAQAEGTHGVLDAVVQAVTDRGAGPPPPTPAVAAALPLAADPVVQAVRSATGRLEPRKVA